jgi:hypothetical protein
MPLRVAPPPAWARALRTCPTVAAAACGNCFTALLLLRRLKERATPLQEAARAARALLCFWRRPDVLEERAQASFRLSLAGPPTGQGEEGPLPWKRRRPRPGPLLLRHRMRQGYPLNLSISLSGGEETNQDAPSNGE